MAARVNGILVLLTDAISLPSSFAHSLRFWLSKLKQIRQPNAFAPPATPPRWVVCMPLIVTLGEE
ncbi:uncharacterized protein N7487_005132 [Penicillium crustosum]|uniref:uncharacterized protein n=1 Tax=Penicillium crustosum TaxID=36656 RepID=UPI00239EA956|nr:uncharacterized protein N7487_005132 [Penicillium crustosum]KAJ5410773.1 hypothetical protein N7487_005132 [Penicillium crustosum]